MSETSRSLILASTSPRRRDLLRSAGFDFKVREPKVHESPLPGEAPADMARRLALEKVSDVAGRVDPASCVLAADTLVVLDGTVFGKPRNERHAAEMLLALAGRTHEVMTGFALGVAGQGPPESAVVVSRVHIREVTSEEAHAYAATGEPLDKAGAYAVQGTGGSFVDRVEGSRSNVIGLPLEAVGPRLEALGVRPCRM